MTITLEEAQGDFASIIGRVRAGERVVILEEGQPVAVVTGPEPLRTPRVPGQAAGKGWISEDFDAPLPDDLQRYFEQ